jgi:hypothetical protein
VSITFPFATVAIIPQPTAQNVHIVGTRLAFRTGTCTGGRLSPIREMPEVTASSGDKLAIFIKSRRVKAFFAMSVSFSTAQENVFKIFVRT